MKDRCTEFVSNSISTTVTFAHNQIKDVLHVKYVWSLFVPDHLTVLNLKSTLTKDKPIHIFKFIQNPHTSTYINFISGRFKKKLNTLSRFLHEGFTEKKL